MSGGESLSVTVALIGVSPSLATTLWGASLAIFAVVLLVVVALLQAILASARRIRGGVAEIWTVGKQIAGNTVQIPTLLRVNQLLEKVVVVAGGIAPALEEIGDHARECDGCPRCLLGGGAETRRL